MVVETSIVRIVARDNDISLAGPITARGDGSKSVVGETGSSCTPPKLNSQSVVLADSAKTERPNVENQSVCLFFRRCFPFMKRGWLSRGIYEKRARVITG